MVYWTYNLAGFIFLDVTTLHSLCFFGFGGGEISLKNANPRTSTSFFLANAIFFVWETVLQVLGEVKETSESKS
ncbi:hypothetical protein CJ030_MR1G028224 [Morella rubra]|uniref:Uncharacterized protein n=1 Tax=Morella rubra TaxID=262757 RepID=A0A6A1WR23_9ROSI|nr:hypothetical protein CJ030_MR1G028224 [Morella rubra]